MGRDRIARALSGLRQSLWGMFHSPDGPGCGAPRSLAGVSTWLLPPLAALGLACSGVKNEVADTPSPPSPAPVEAAPDIAPAPTSEVGAARELEGTLAYTPLPREKSVEAYLGVEFTLKTSDGAVILSAPAADPGLREALVASHDQRVRVSCVMRKGAVPEPHESYPMDMDGKPMERPDTCEVRSLER